MGADVTDVADHPEGQVDQVAAQVGDRGAAQFAVEAPVESGGGVGELVG
ncbi:MAG TPA: hypothetical protein VN767_12785 [Streptosporangiaceae bacterium]|nr:hypothetical protein [Streptosporangiaceae bacterium]